MNYDSVINEFTHYLKTLHYSSNVCYACPNDVLIFLTHIDIPFQELKTQHFLEFFTYYQSSVSPRTHRIRSNIRINEIIMNCKRFSKFLFHMYSMKINTIAFKTLKNDTKEKIILSQSEINLLFDTCDNSKIGLRDKAMLSIYYSCGLRRQEGILLELSDIDFINNVLFVKYGKAGKQRFVPFTSHTHDILRTYINIGRRRLNGKHHYRKTLFLNYRGDKIGSQSFSLRLKTLCKRCDISRPVGLHTLRHSIATHLLQNKMSIYDIRDFLGHASLDSTQIYTHIVS